jgi:NADPH:quinone reductase-like Zn-dependent oxidoreductase
LMIDLKIAVPGSLTGADYAGVVVEVGPGVQRDFKPGDRVCGATRNGDPRQPENGVFAEYVVVKADIQLKIPASMGFDQAASLGVTTLTTGRCFVSFPI